MHVLYCVFSVNSNMTRNTKDTVLFYLNVCCYPCVTTTDSMDMDLSFGLCADGELKLTFACNTSY